MAVAVSGIAAAQDFKPKQAGDIVVRARGIGLLPNEGGVVRDRGTGADTGMRIGNITDEASSVMLPMRMPVSATSPTRPCPSSTSRISSRRIWRWS
jgi:hypothetical protein